MIATLFACVFRLKIRKALFETLPRIGKARRDQFGMLRGCFLRVDVLIYAGNKL